MDIVKSIEHEQLKNKIPDLKVGNTVKVHVRIKEGNKERIQVFEGTIIKVQGSGVNRTFTVRKISYGVGVEKTFLIHSPLVEKVELVRVGHARRAKLFYLRDRVGKSAKTREIAGARIEDKEIEIKGEEVVEEPAQEAEVVSEETTVNEVVETPIEEATAETTATEEVVEAPVEETTETTAEAEVVEAPAEATATEDAVEATETVEKEEVAEEATKEVAEEKAEAPAEDIAEKEMENKATTEDAE